MSAWKTFLLVLTLFAFNTETIADVFGRVVSVTDGDTIKVLDSNNTQHKIRLTGIDAPERGQPFGSASKKHLTKLVAGKQVKIESNKSDRYGRVLGKVWVNGTDANLEQVKAGYAWWYKYYAKEQPVADRRSYSKAEETARNKKLGLWADPNPVQPYEWRKANK